MFADYDNNPKDGWKEHSKKEGISCLQHATDNIDGIKSCMCVWSIPKPPKADWSVMNSVMQEWGEKQRKNNPMIAAYQELHQKTDVLLDGFKLKTYAIGQALINVPIPFFPKKTSVHQECGMFDEEKKISRMVMEGLMEEYAFDASGKPFVDKRFCKYPMYSSMEVKESKNEKAEDCFDIKFYRVMGKPAAIVPAMAINSAFPGRILDIQIDLKKMLEKKFASL